MTIKAKTLVFCENFMSTDSPTRSRNVEGEIRSPTYALCTGYHIATPWRRLLVNCVPMREQSTAKLTLSSVFDILKLIPLFTVSSQKVLNRFQCSN